jgi:hypothetical protein
MMGCTQSDVYMMPAANAAAHPFILVLESNCILSFSFFPQHNIVVQD